MAPLAPDIGDHRDRSNRVGLYRRWATSGAQRRRELVEAFGRPSDRFSHELWVRVGGCAVTHGPSGRPPDQAPRRSSSRGGGVPDTGLACARVRAIGTGRRRGGPVRGGQAPPRSPHRGGGSTPERVLWRVRAIERWRRSRAGAHVTARVGSRDRRGCPGQSSGRVLAGDELARPSGQGHDRQRGADGAVGHE